MNYVEIEVFINSKNPKTKGKAYYQLMYDRDVFGGMVTTDVKMKGDVFVPMGSWITGKCTLQDVKVPYNTSIISMSVHEGQQLGQIGDYELVKDHRIARGVYVSGLIRKAEHESLNARTIIGYSLHIYGRAHVSIKVYKNIQKKAKKENFAGRFEIR